MAISRVAFSGPFTANNANLTVTEPTGTQQNDVLFVWVAHRSTVGYDAPAGWTKLEDQSSGDITASSTSSISSGELFYIVRGASAPTLTFTKQAGTGDIAHSYCIAYRGVDTTTPIDSSTSTTLATASTNVVTASTLAIPVDHAAVIFLAGARNVFWTTQQSNTGPTTFTELTDAGSTTGGDVSDSLAEYINTGSAISAGAFSAVASASARHVIAGVVLNPAPTAVSLLTDNFNDNSRDTAKWNVGNPFALNATGITVAETSGQLRVTPDTLTDVYSGYLSASSHSLTGSSAYVKLVQPLSGGSTESIFSLNSDSSNCVMWYEAAGTLRATQKVANGNTHRYTIAYSSSTHAWLRIRESGGTTYWDTAPSTASDPPQESDWVNRASIANPITLTALTVYVGGGCYSPNTVTPGTVIWDGFNTASTAGVNADVTSVTGTGAVGSVTVSGAASYTLSGVVGTGAVGDETVSAAASTVLSGTEATGSVGGVTTSVHITAAVTGVSATGELGSTGIEGAATFVDVTSVTGTGAVGTASVPEYVPVSGVSATSAVGTATAEARRSVSELAQPVMAEGQIGLVGLSVGSNITVTSVTGTGAVGSAVANIQDIILRASAGSFTLRSTAGSQVITGLGFTPKLVRFWMEEVAQVGGNNQIRMTFGAATAALEQWAGVASHTPATGSSYNQFRTDKCLQLADSATATVVASAAFTSMDGNGFTLNVTTGSSKTVYYEAIGGSGVTAFCGSFNAPASTSGAQAVTGVGFRPKALFFCPGPKRTDGAMQGDIELGIGVCTSSAQAATNYYIQDVNGVTRAASGLYTDSCILGMQAISPAAYAFKAAFTSFDLDGFTVNWTSSPYFAAKIGYIALAGVAQYRVGTFNTPTGVGTQSVTGVGMTPVSTFFFTHGEPAATVAKNGALNSFGIATSPTAHSVASFYTPHNNSTAGYPIGYTSVASPIAFTAATGNGIASVRASSVTHVDNGFNISWATLDGRQSRIAYMAVGLTQQILTGVSATAALGTVTAAAKATAAVTAVTGTGTLGTVGAGEFRFVPVTTTPAAGQIGTATATGGASVAVSGVESTATLGSWEFAGHLLDVAATSVTGTGEIGSAGFSSTVVLHASSFYLQTALGLVVVDGKTTIPVDGVVGTGEIGATIIHHNCLIDNIVGVSGFALAPMLPVVYTAEFGIIPALQSQWADSVGSNTSAWDDADSPAHGGWNGKPPA